jgi:hypothetical protein
MTFKDWREMLVWLAAHEFAHALQGPSGPMNPHPEQNAEWNGWNALMAYRQGVPK